MKIIGLLGLTFESDNKGCMALAYTFENLLDECAKEDIEKIYVFSFDKYFVATDDFDCPIEIVYMSVKKPFTILKAKSLMQECDYIFDFSEGDSFSDIYGLKRFIKISLIKEIAVRTCDKYILCPQTYGPYKSWLSKIIAKDILRNAYYVCARDLTSSNLVSKLINKPVDTFTDIALGLNSKSIDMNLDEGIKHIGINVSALLWNGGYANNNQFDLKVNYQDYIKKLIVNIHNTGEYKIHLIPHVYNESDSGIENDYAICLILQKEFPYCIVPECYHLPSEIKRYISNMDFFIGARMHATIAAFSTRVVTVPFSYSRKFEGLFNSVNYLFTINARELETEDALRQTISYINRRDELASAQQNSLEIVNYKLEQFKMKLLQILSS